MTKMTNVKALEYVLETFDEEMLPTEVREKLSNMKKSYERKSSTKKPTEKQKKNEELKNVILDILVGEDKPMTITEIQKANENLAEFSNQKISSLVRQLVNEELAERIEEKKKAYFKAK